MNYPGTLSCTGAAWHRKTFLGAVGKPRETTDKTRGLPLCEKGATQCVSYSNYSYIKYIYNIKNRVYIRSYIWLNWQPQHHTSEILVTLVFNRCFVVFKRRKLLTRKDKYVSINYDFLIWIINGYVIRIYLLRNLHLDKRISYAKI